MSIDLADAFTATGSLGEPGTADRLGIDLKTRGSATFSGSSTEIEADMTAEPPGDRA